MKLVDGGLYDGFIAMCDPVMVDGTVSKRRVLTREKTDTFVSAITVCSFCELKYK